MAIRVALNHKTHHRYARDVWLSPQVIRLRPAPHCRTPITSYSLTATPKDCFTNWQQDPYGNYLARLVFPNKTRDFGIEIDLVAELTVINPFDFFVEKHAELFPFDYGDVLRRELAPYLAAAPLGPKLQALLNEARGSSGPTVNYLVALNQKLSQQVKYVIRMEPGVQEPEHTLTCLSGSCRDTSWLLVQLFRNLGLAARFVSGYLIQLAPDVRPLEGPGGVTTDFTDLHAWVEVYLPGAGWVGFDPTSGLMAGEGHIPLACSAEPSTAAAITGFYSVDNPDVLNADAGDSAEPHPPGEDQFHFSMSVTRIHEDPRVTKPYTDAQWAEIDWLGKRVDQELVRNDVRLTMGGEPTFIATEGVDAAEWNSDAMGPTKHVIADKLVRRLRDRFAPGAFLHHGQGKWYPGEVLPRWAYGLYWRKDGKPLWKNADLIADAASPASLPEDAARQFVTELSTRLGVNPKFVMPGYEDVWHYISKEQRLAINVDPADSRLANAQDRARLARVFEQGLGKVVGYCLPVQRKHEADGSARWISSKWFFRNDRMYLVPGDSPMGYRLPLDSLPWVAPDDFPHQHERDPFEARGALSEESNEHRERASGDSAADAPPKVGESAKDLVRTALCVEVRGNLLRIFAPPVPVVEDYISLITAIEATAEALGIPVQVEGYGPPYDPRVVEVKVTPDPGVIEINAQPVATWDELVKNTDALYEEARQCRLGTEKFLVDGRHVGTGGGNHIVFGGPTPGDSPILRKPSLLRSMLGFWHNHPSLSYLFSGMFVGPTSQAPRVDEARNDQVYELELAFKQIPDDDNIAPWLVDRIFRNLLIDSTGNTHRAEFCIDKLYAPESATGRLGLLEMRGFEMPPHPRMSLTQHLLLRALIAHFWQKPYVKPLVRWKTEIHDRFMMPHFVRLDFEDVIAHLNEAGYALKPEWFAPHLEFRFPLLGTVVQNGITVELRQAIEPWHVLGEEPAGGTTVRYVDSSLERVQLLISGMTDSRHVITANGVSVPLHPTGVNGQFVAGVRYRAWRPASCLHPLVQRHAPLTFDVVDSWSGRSIGGCQYHVAHPGGRNYETAPVNAYEAESRRVARFFPFGHTPGPAKIIHGQPSREFPFTLDLRQYIR